MADAAKPEDAKPAGGGSKMLLIIGLVAGLGLGAGGGFFFFKGQGEAPANEAGNHAPAEAEASNEEPLFAPMRNVPASLIAEDGTVIGYVFFDLNLEVANQEDYEFVSARIPIIQDALIKDMSKNPITKQGHAGDIDYERATARFVVVANEALEGGNRVKAVQIDKAVRQ